MKLRSDSLKYFILILSNITCRSEPVEVLAEEIHNETHTMGAGEHQTRGDRGREIGRIKEGNEGNREWNRMDWIVNCVHLIVSNSERKNVTYILHKGF